MAVVLIEIHQIRENHSGMNLFQRRYRLGHSIGIVFALFMIANSAAQEDVEDLADAKYLKSRVV